jgi:hypothetical protein
MAYRLKRPDDINWFDLLHLEHPERAVDVITQFKGPHYQGQSISQLIHGIDQLCPGGYINQSVVESALRSGDFFLVPFGEAMSPLLRYIVTINTNNALGNQQTSEWQLSSNTHSDHLTSTLQSLMRDVKEPVRVAAAVRQKAKPDNGSSNQGQKDKAKEIYWVELVCEYKDPEVNSSEDVGSLPYKATFSDGSTEKGYLTSGYTKLNNIPGGEVKAGAFAIPCKGAFLVKTN